MNRRRVINAARQRRNFLTGDGTAHFSGRRAADTNADNKTGQLALPQWGFVGRSPTRTPPSQQSAIRLCSLLSMPFSGFLHKSRNFLGGREEANLTLMKLASIKGLFSVMAYKGVMM